VRRVWFHHRLACFRGLLNAPEKRRLSFRKYELPMLRTLTDRGTAYCCRTERHHYELQLVLTDIDHTTTKAKSPQTNGICERFHKTVLQEY
jgi:transposase InsO family protein